jgi:hypothetical protein
MLSDRLAGDLGWRKKELTDIRQLAQLAGNQPRRRVLTRCGVALLYAHFEGFTRQAGQAYLEYVAAQRLTYDKIARNLMAVALCESLSPVADSRKASVYQRGVHLLLDSGAERAMIPYKTAVKTDSNLSSKVLKEILFVLGLDYGLYASKEKLIDGRLLARRNHVAHGEDIGLDDEDYDELHESVIEMLNLLRNQIENAVAQRIFLRSA